MDKIFYLTFEDIVEAHKEGFYTFGGETYMVYESCVHNRVVEPQTKYFGEEQYPGLLLKAALYFHRLNTSHCFADGNKRAAVISTDLFLKFNGYKLKVSQKELFDYACIVADKDTRPPLEEVEYWIRQNTVPYEFETLYDFLDEE